MASNFVVTLYRTAERLFAEAFPSCAVHYYACLSPGAFRATFLALNSLRMLSRLPRAAFTSGRGVAKQVPQEPFCYWASVRREGRARAVDQGAGE